eukprot:1360402-Karenia_brevis.AAC.1
MSPPPSAPPVMTPQQQQELMQASLAAAKARASFITARAQALADGVTPAVPPDERRRSWERAENAERAET